MPDNIAIIQSLTIDRLKFTKPDGNISLEILYTVVMLINEHESVFQKDVVIPLPENLQTDTNNLWGDLRES